MLGPLIRRFRQGSMKSKVREAIEEGVGLYDIHWELGSKADGALQAEAASTAVLDWCRETMGQMRRPYGLDYVTLALAVLGPDNEELARASFGVLRPSDFYNDGPAPKRLQELLSQWRSEGHLRSSQSLSAVMFSWGDLTRELLIAS
jgi:hypothetical protein